MRASSTGFDGRSGDKIEFPYAGAYPPGWKAIQLQPGTWPQGWKEWVRVFWGLDIWILGIPFMRTILAINLVLWL